MSRHLTALLTTAATFGILVVGGGQANSPHRATAPSSRPNVVVIETDDQTLAEMAVLPKTRRLIGGQGVTFDNNFDSFSLCCPSRASLLTGQYSHNNGVRGNALPYGGYYKLDSTNTLAVWLQRDGYYTTHLGKYLNGYGTRSATEIPPGWSEWHGSVDPSTYRYYGYKLNENGTVTTYCAKPQAACYQTDVYRDKADEIVRRRAPQPQPFFLWVAFLGNHSGGPAEADDPKGLATPVPAPRYKDAFKNTPLPTPPSFNEADMSDKPLAMQKRPLLTQANMNAIRENWQQRRETLLAVDDAVESIVQTLAQTGELGNTLILFTSDNGFFHGEHRVKNGKVLLYEPSIRVPLLMRWDGHLPRGVHRKQPTMNIDYTATILDAARVKSGRVMDGMSLLPFARDGARQPARDLLVDNTPGTGHFDAIRTRHYLYAEHATGERELYDLARDPYELQSRHNDAAYAPIRASLAARLHRLVTCAGRTCRPGLAVRLSLRCGRHVLHVRVTGTGVRLVTFSKNGRRVKVDARAPFGATISWRTKARLRSLVSMKFDRLGTVDRTVGRCG